MIWSSPDKLQEAEEELEEGLIEEEGDQEWLMSKTSPLRLMEMTSQSSSRSRKEFDLSEVTAICCLLPMAS